MRSSGNEQSCEPSKTITPAKLLSEEKKTEQETIKCVQRDETRTISELLISGHDCPLSSVLNLPLSKGTSSSSTEVAALHPPAGEQFIPAHYPYPQEALKRSDEAMIMSGVLNFENQELMAIQNTCNPPVDRNTPYFSNHRLFEMKEESSFHAREVEITPDSARKASEAAKNEKQYATRMGRVSLPIKFGENSRKRQRTNSDGVKTASQRKMAHLDKEKERRLRQTKCYDYLRSLVPCGSQKTDKANILETTVAYVSYIKETLGTNMDVIDKNFLDDFERNKESLD